MKSSAALRTWRLRNKLTLQELADLTGLSISMLSRVERGKRTLSPKTKVLVARCVGARIRDLFPVGQRVNR
jgi:transcriptional regulator with XRE-family HTH domain